MRIREASQGDQEAITAVTERSLTESYSLSPSTIGEAVDDWYAPGAFGAKLDRNDVVLLVAEDETGEVVAFSEGLLVAEGEQGDLLWLHVHPAHRGRGFGAELFDRMDERLRRMGAEHLRGRVLADNQLGASFYRERGFEHVEDDRIEIDGEEYVEYVFSNAVSRQLRSLVTDDGSVVYVDTTDGEVGSDAPFLVVLDDPNGEGRYGFFCTNCDRLANAMSPNGRIRCGTCGNTRKPTRWDASYL